MWRQLILLALVTLTVMDSRAQAPDSLGFQGYLTDSLGVPLDSANVSATFRLYKDGTEVWIETQLLNVSDGVFNVLLGSNTALKTLAFNQAMDLGITLDGVGIEMTPRTPLAAAAYAKALPGLYTVYQEDVIAKGYHVIGGSPINSVHPDAIGATIAGGGGYWMGSPRPNVAEKRFSTVGGGKGNTASGGHATVAGGSANTASGQYYPTVSGGYTNISSGSYAVVSGGNNNVASGEASTIGGGGPNVASGDSSTVAGGTNNSAGAMSSAVGGGFDNSAVGESSTVGGGELNQAKGSHSTVSGGFGNTAQDNGTAIGGGWEHVAEGLASTIGGGEKNSTLVQYATVAGGKENSAQANASFVGGGDGNQASGQYSVIGGGASSNASGEYSVVAGGQINAAGGQYAATGGGQDNIANGDFSTVPGGYLNRALGTYSFAIGANAGAIHGGSFVWQDSTGAGASGDTLKSTNENQFLARASGGFKFLTSPSPYDTSGAELAAGSGSWASLSSRTSKSGFVQVDTREYLDRVASLSLQKWSYRTEPGVTHVGPMAEDFYAAFGHGPNPNSITSVDADGVALAAIQGLYELVKEQQAVLASLQAENHRMAEAMRRAGIED